MKREGSSSISDLFHRDGKIANKLILSTSVAGTQIHTED